MTPEHRDIPHWAQRERQADLGWMRIDCIRAENLDVFSAIASVAFEDEGRGAIVVDTTIQPMPGAGHPFGYFTQKTVEKQHDEDIRGDADRVGGSRRLRGRLPPPLLGGTGWCAASRRGELTME